MIFFQFQQDFRQIFLCHKLVNVVRTVENSVNKIAFSELLFQHIVQRIRETPFYKLHDLTRRIAELTEEIEELKTEKEMLLHSLDCADDAGISAVKKEIATMESSLQKLSEQEKKYSTELDNALKQYAELQEQTAEFDPVELYEARQEIRPDHERNATRRIQNAYGDKYDMLRMYDSKRSVANLLSEAAEERSVREKLRTIQKEQKSQQQKKPKYKDWER